MDKNPDVCFISPEKIPTEPDKIGLGAGLQMLGELELSCFGLGQIYTPKDSYDFLLNEQGSYSF
jgi:hypothetical protein